MKRLLMSFTGTRVEVVFQKCDFELEGGFIEVLGLPSGQTILRN